MLLYPSLMCADFARLGEEVDQLCEAGADGFHLDVMDGHFVRNIGMGLGDINAICARTQISCDIHLMAEDSRSLVDLFASMDVHTIFVHPETERVVNSTLDQIRTLGIHPGIVIDPGVSFSAVESSLPVADSVLLMTVNPGFAGQLYLEYVTPKISQFAAAKDHFEYHLIIDGACSPDAIRRASLLGADGAVLGTNALFGKTRSYAEILSKLHTSC